MNKPTENQVEIEIGGQQLRCTFTYSPGTPDVRTLPNGDPGYPGDPPEFVVTKVELMLKPRLIVGLVAYWLDITALVQKLDDGDLVGATAEEQAEKEGFFDEPDRFYEPDEPEEDDGTLADKAQADWEAWRDDLAARGERP